MSENRRKTPKVTAPATPPVPQEEIKRRRKIIAEMLETRDKIGPIGMTTAELLAPEEDDD